MGIYVLASGWKRKMCQRKKRRRVGRWTSGGGKGGVKIIKGVLGFNLVEKPQ